MRIGLLSLALVACAAGFAAAPAPAPVPTPDIKVDQVGYLPEAPKVAMVVSKTPATSFVVRRAGGGAIVHRGTLAALPRVNPSSREDVPQRSGVVRDQRDRDQLERAARVPAGGPAAGEEVGGR